MTVAVDLSGDEIALIRRMTRLEDDAQAVTKAAREYLRLLGLRELKAASGHVDYEDNWQPLEALELAEMTFPHEPTE